MRCILSHWVLILLVGSFPEGNRPKRIIFDFDNAFCGFFGSVVPDNQVVNSYGYYYIVGVTSVVALITYTPK